MLKVAAIVSLMLIVAWPPADSRRYKKDATPSRDFVPGSTLWAAGLSCESCGRECASACGTRHFRACCFNYLRRKRIPPATDINKIWSTNGIRQNKMAEHKLNKKVPIFAIEDVPEPYWMNNVVSNDEFDSYPLEDSLENRLPILNDV